MPQLINLSRKGLDFFKDAPDFLFIYSTRQFIPRFVILNERSESKYVILSERSESKEPLRIQADPSAAPGMTIEDHLG
ncbi:hypothetical protein CLV53_10671 [Sediminibacterium magnilacihabitans]|nr:hypothetical protein CLV53_10671 [Sediminibacterium magnilacihabitans]